MDAHPSGDKPQAPVVSDKPRALAQGTGLVLQGLGGVLFLTTCCVCGTTGVWDPIPPVSVIEQQSPVAGWADDPGRAGLMLLIVSCSVGGLALAGFGLGLQSDRRGAATGALVSIGLFIATMTLAGAGIWTGDAAFVTRLWHGGLSLILLATLVLVVAAWRQVRANPPPPNVSDIPPGTKIPYSLYHDDPPDVRLARELADRRARLDAERLELDRLEQELRDKQKPD